MGRNPFVQITKRYREIKEPVSVNTTKTAEDVCTNEQRQADLIMTSSVGDRSGS